MFTVIQMKRKWLQKVKLYPFFIQPLSKQRFLFCGKRLLKVEGCLGTTHWAHAILTFDLTEWNLTCHIYSLKRTVIVPLFCFKYIYKCKSYGPGKCKRTSGWTNAHTYTLNCHYDDNVTLATSRLHQILLEKQKILPTRIFSFSKNSFQILKWEFDLCSHVLSVDCWWFQFWQVYC